MHLGVAAKVTTLDKTHFAEVERIGILLKNRRTSAAASAAASLAGVKGPDDLPLRPEVRERGLPCVLMRDTPWHGDGVGAVGAACDALFLVVLVGDGGDVGLNSVLLQQARDK